MTYCSGYWYNVGDGKKWAAHTDHAEKRGPMRVGVTYVKRADYQGSVELEDEVIVERFQDEHISLGSMTLDGTTASVEIEIDIEDLVTDAVEAGDVEEEEITSESEIIDVEVTGLE